MSRLALSERAAGWRARLVRGQSGYHSINFSPPRATVCGGFLLPATANIKQTQWSVSNDYHPNAADQSNFND
jgi:hypothetical protein